MTLFHQVLDEAAGRFGALTALRYRERDCPYEELRERSTALAGGLTSLGIERADRIAVYMPNRPEVVETALACSRLGAIFVPANPLLKGRQLSHLLRDSGARLLVTSASISVSLADLHLNCPQLQAVVLCDLTDSRRAPGIGLRWVAYQDVIADGGGSLPRPPVIDRDPAALFYTSGSTGRPKGVVVSHRNLVDGARCVAGYLGNRADDRVLAALPLSFDYGFSQVSTAFTTGACAVLSNFSLSAALIQEVSTEGITGLAGVPTMWMHVGACEWPQQAVKTLRYITNSGGTLPSATLRTLQKCLPETRIYCMYGLTEAFRSTYLDPAQLASRPGSIGKAISNQEVLVLRPDGSRCEPGETGELVHRGSLVALGYWNDPELTAARFRPLPRQPAELPREEIAVWSGDRVRTDQDGYLYFVGRADQLIKTSGYRVSPTEIEEVALEVAGVIESAAVGVPDATLGQRVVLLIVGQPATAPGLPERVRQHCRMHLPPYLVPAEIRLIPDLPRSPNGKQDRAAFLILAQQAGNS